MGSRTYISYDGSPEQQVERISIDYDLFKTLDMKLVAGREYDREFSTDAKESILVNEALVKKLGIEDPVGKTIEHGRDKTIIGVVQNFHFRSLHHKLNPPFCPSLQVNGPCGFAFTPKMYPAPSHL